MEFNTFTVLSTAATGISVPMKYILPDIVMAQHFALLIILTLRNRLAFLYGFEKLQIKLCGFYNDFGDRKQGAYTLDSGNVLLNLDLYRRSKPAFVLCTSTIVKSGLAVPGGTVPAGTAEFSAGRQ